jgi:hypothetical protein
MVAATYVHFATHNALGTTLFIFMLFLLSLLIGSLRRATRLADCARGTCLEQQFWKEFAYRRHWAAT